MMPKIGMHYEDVRKRLKGPLGKDKNLRESLLNQARLCDGEKAKKELESELSFRRNSFSGVGNKQIGIGEGHKLGEGKWRYQDGKWEKID